MKTLIASLPPAYKMSLDTAPLERRPALDSAERLNKFLAGIERRGYRIAQIALGDVEDALDAVQETMLRLARNYPDRNEAEWRPLFYRILRSRITDIQRRRTVRNRVMVWFGGFKQDEDRGDPIESIGDDGRMDPAAQTAAADAIDSLEQSIRKLPRRQQEAFTLRILEGMDVAQTAEAMRCSTGSVKTHLSRAMAALRKDLEEHRT